MSEGKLLIGSPICQNPKILENFLCSIKRLKIPDHEVFYYFIDDNHESDSRILLQKFQQETKNAIVEDLHEQSDFLPYKDHSWHEFNIWKVAAYKNCILRRAKAEAFDYLFFVDSDVLLHPETVSHLIQSHKDIISEIFWTKWTPLSAEQPQVWLKDFYTQYELQPGETISKEEENRRILAFYQMLRTPGIYEVGGLGACTLISKSAIQKGVSFEKIKNISMRGEDRHFCIRAAALGIDLFVDTHYPAYHIYRLEQLPEGELFLTETSTAPLKEQD